MSDQKGWAVEFAGRHVMAGYLPAEGENSEGIGVELAREGVGPTATLLEEGGKAITRFSLSLDAACALVTVLQAAIADANEKKPRRSGASEEGGG